MQGYVGIKWQCDQSTTVSPTLAITWPHGVHNEENSFAVAAQVYGDVRQFKVTSKKCSLRPDETDAGQALQRV
jgi:hypothetical protein